jgi:HEAT repeat protein
MQRRGKWSLTGAVALVATFGTGVARAASDGGTGDADAASDGGTGDADAEDEAHRLPPLPPQVREDCWLRAPADEPPIPCELVLTGNDPRGDDRAVLVRERGGARRRGVAIQVRGSLVELLGAGHATGSLGADLGWMKAWAVVHNRDRKYALDRDALLLSPAAASGARGLPASVLVPPTLEDAELVTLGRSPDGVYAAIGLTDPRRRFVALDLLAHAYDVQPVKAWLLPGLDDRDELVRLAVAEALGASKVTEAAESVAAWLAPGRRTDVSPFTRRQIARVLGALATPPGEAALESALADAAFDVREAAVWALGEIGAPAAAPLVAARVEDEDPRVRRAAAQALGRFKDGGVLAPAFRKAFADPDARTRLAAVRAAAPLELGALVPAFIERLQDPDGEVQYAAVGALVKLRAREAAPHLVPLLKSRGARVKQYALCFWPSTWLALDCAAAKALQALGDAPGIAEAKRLVPNCLAAAAK